MNLVTILFKTLFLNIFCLVTIPPIYTFLNRCLIRINSVFNYLTYLVSVMFFLPDSSHCCHRCLSSPATVGTYSHGPAHYSCVLCHCPMTSRSRHQHSKEFSAPDFRAYQHHSPHRTFRRCAVHYYCRTIDPSRR